MQPTLKIHSWSLPCNAVPRNLFLENNHGSTKKKKRLAINTFTVTLFKVNHLNKLWYRHIVEHYVTNSNDTGEQQ